MKTRLDNKSNSHHGQNAVTFLDVVIAICVVLLLFFFVGLILPSFAHYHNGPRISCVSNLKRVGLASLVYAYDNNKRFPMETLTNQSGSPLYFTSPELVRYFQVMSNELSDPRILICPEDRNRKAATNFTTDFDSSHISYFLCLNANETHSNAFLCGDSNITNGYPAKKGLLELTTNQNFGWTLERHHQAGNVGFADGSVQELDSMQVKNALIKTGLATNLLLMPR